MPDTARLIAQLASLERRTARGSGKDSVDHPQGNGCDQQHYGTVSDWIDGHHLKARVVYYRVCDPAREARIPTPTWR